jgi:hypothetical protein
MNVNTKSSQKVANTFSCESCNYYTSKKSNFTKHLLTSKHTTLIKVNDFVNESSQKVAVKHFTCQKCNKIFKSYVGLWKHNKKCKFDKNYDIEQTDISKQKDATEPSTLDKDQLIIMLVKQNTELMEILKHGVNNTTNNNINTNSHNKAFNLNFFLNETCKNAMNINDFVDSIKLELNDLEKVGEVGYIEGISNIIIKNLNALTETERPLHCTDKKRETIYIKDQGQWEKEDDNKTKLKKAINKVVHKNIKLISQFREKYPECRKSDSRISDKYNKMIIEAMGGLGDNNVEKEEKIIKNITKATIINK